MPDLNEQQMERAFRRRVQLQALHHRIGQSIAGHVVMRFRKAGTWDGEIARPVPPILHEVLTQKDHPLRAPAPHGPLIVFLQDSSLWIVEVSDHFLSHDAEIRRAVLQHFLGAQEDTECWMSPYVLDLLERNASALTNPDERVWINAGLLLRDAVGQDFRAQCAGVRQAAWLRHEKSYEEYLKAVVGPRAHSLEHDRPPIWNPAEESEEIWAKIQEWSALSSTFAV